MAQASTGYFAISKESVAGTAITTPTDFLPVEEVDFSFENEFIDIREIRGSRQAFQVADGRLAPSATIRGALYPTGATGLIFGGLFGDDTAEEVVADSDAFEHVFSDGPLPSFTLERSDATSGAGGILTERMAGAKVESVSLSAAFGEKVDFEVSFQATKSPATATAVAATSITYPVCKPVVFTGSSVKIGGTPNSKFKSINVEFTNTLERQEGLNGSQEAFAIFEGGMDVSFSGTMIFDSLDMYNRVKSGDEIEVDLIFNSSTTIETGVPYSLQINMPIVRTARCSAPFRAGEVIEADVDFRVIYSDTDKGSAIVTMITEENTAYV